MSHKMKFKKQKLYPQHKGQKIGRDPKTEYIATYIDRND